MKRKFFAALLTMLLCLFCFPGVVFADIGPKPSVEVAFEGMEGSWYVTLLSESSSTGPYSVSDDSMSPGHWLAAQGNDALEAWKAFRDYVDPDGYYFIEYFTPASESEPFRWTYYPPKRFKVLIWFPEDGSYAVTGILERYAFDSYFTADISQMEAVTGAESTPVFQVSKSYPYGWEVLSLVARIIGTILIEMLVALFFFPLGEKKVWRLILVVNLATQTLLNLLLNLSNYAEGPWMFVFQYIWMELVVFGLEAVVYSVWLHRRRPETRHWVGPVYALVANAASFGIGLFLARVIPGIF